jgi:hypothetical protein
MAEATAVLEPRPRYDERPLELQNVAVMTAPDLVADEVARFLSE